MPLEKTGAPYWVRIFAIVAAALFVLVVIVLVTGLGGSHGPWRHMTGTTSDEPAP
jgi:hypothetical protein